MDSYMPSSAPLALAVSPLQDKELAPYVIEPEGQSVSLALAGHWVSEGHAAWRMPSTSVRRHRGSGASAPFWRPPRFRPITSFAAFMAATTALTNGSSALAQAVAADPGQQAANRGAAAEAPAGKPSADIAEIVVTAQKRAQSINKVPMSITALSGTALTSLGVTNTAQLTKVVPGFNFTETVYGTPVYTIRGVGFQESSLAGSPAVSVYVDEVPLPFPVE